MHIYKPYLLSLSLLQATYRLHAFDSIETTKAALVTTLKKYNPSVLAEFSLLFKRYEQIVFDFFDTNNHNPLSMHLNRMYEELETLERVCSNSQFDSITPTLRTYQKQLQELVTLLHSYRGPLDIVPLGFKVRKFKFLLPGAIQQRGDAALFWALQHRLRCS